MELINCYKLEGGEKLQLCIKDVEGNFHGVEMRLKQMPFLWDASSDELYLTQVANTLARLCAEKTRQYPQAAGAEVWVPAKLVEQRFSYCPGVPFEYSSLEYYSIPGLAHGMSNDGYLAPLYFNLEVLSKYERNPKYKIRIYSGSYGDIWCGEDWHISFGVNGARQVLMWLGDVDQLPLKEQQYLLSENIASTYDLHSDFYDAQIECEWSQGAIEGKCLRLREAISDAVHTRAGMPMYKLPDEVGKTIESLERPIFWEDRHVAPVIESLNRIFVESLDEACLKRLLTSRGVEVNEKLRGLKLMGRLLADMIGEARSMEVMKPLFVLYDFRVNVCHLLPAYKLEASRRLINERLGLQLDNASHEKTYDALFLLLHTSLLEIEQMVLSWPTASADEC
ncbi:hypothetical protein [Pseudomonas sp. UFMG81]|uniref:hypothetical protein n=1 Tax=Pseudomonas sp. UFMG81 TaxID=2745936 RepID=UPI00188E8A0F|nr:hypothetical protein [Pseudomonas sp. UFMG81]